MSDAFIFDDELLQFCSGVAGLVEATDCERQYLWQAYSVEAEGLQEYMVKPYTGHPRLRWFSHGMLLSRTIGTLMGRPICLQCARATIGGKTIIFWTMTSQLADYKMASDFIKALLSKLGADPRQTDAINFHIAV